MALFLQLMGHHFQFQIDFSNEFSHWFENPPNNFSPHVSYLSFYFYFYFIIIIIIIIFCSRWVNEVQKTKGLI